MIGLQTRADQSLYEQQLTVRLVACSCAFERVAELEKRALKHRALVRNKVWRRDYLLAMNQFRLECLALGKIDDAPPGYEDGDCWIRQAAVQGAHSAELHLEAIQKMDQALMDEGVALFKAFQDCIRQSQKCFPHLFFDQSTAD